MTFARVAFAAESNTRTALSVTVPVPKALELLPTSVPAVITGPPV